MLQTHFQPQEIRSLEGNFIMTFMPWAALQRPRDDSAAAPVLEGCTAWMLLLKIQANRAEHREAGPLRRHTVTGSSGVKEDFSEKVAFEPGFEE